MKLSSLLVFISILIIHMACSSDTSSATNSNPRIDGAHKLNINLSGSLQNPAFSPDGKTIVFTRFRDGYNLGVSDLFIYNLATEDVINLVSDGKSNVNLPGSSWNTNINSVVFSSDRGSHDEIFLISPVDTAGNIIQITDRLDKQTFEPTFSPDGLSVVFESHVLDVDTDGVIMKFRVDGSSGYISLTTTDNNKQPNWSPIGGEILYQKQNTVNGNWAIFTMDDIDGANKLMITNPNENATDAVFSSDGQWIIYSSENANVEIANIYKIPSTGGMATRLTTHDSYDGAPSISPDSTKIAFESVNAEPDTSSGTTIWIIDITL